MSVSGFRKGVFHDVLMLEVSCLEMPAEWQLASEELSSLLCHHLLCVKICFSGRSANILTAVLYKRAGAPAPKAVLVIFFWYNWTALVKWAMYSTDWSAYFAQCFHFLVSWRLCLFFPLQFHTWFLFCHIISNGCNLTGKSTAALQLAWGK